MVPQPEKDAHPRLIVYGGSFDPPHNGHVGCVGKILERFPSSRVLVTPTPAPPPVGANVKHPSASIHDRLEMCRAAFGPLGQEVEVSEIEATLPAPSYTVATLRALQQTTSEALGLMVGQDQLAQFDRWREPLDILRRASLVVLARPHSACEEPTSPSTWLEELRDLTLALGQRLGLASAWSPRDQAVTLTPSSKDWYGKVYFLSGIVGAISSRALREELQSKIATRVDGLPTTVGQYILRHGLYHSPTNPSISC